MTREFEPAGAHPAPLLVKICGITRRPDAEAAVGCGARAVGFVFWPNSPRYVTPGVARAIAAGLPPFVTPVGVFVNQPLAEVAAVADEVRLGAVQLHGDETIDYAAQVERPVVKAIGLQGDVASGADDWPPRVLLLLDAFDRERRGGTGRTVNWAAAAAIARRRPVLLAGGLTPENVADAVARVRPFGIDVSSGVEREPGVKDHDRLRALFAALSSR